MEIETVNEAPHEATAASPKKKPYKTPMLNLYGAVHQFTQGSGGSASDNGAMTMMA